MVLAWNRNCFQQRLRPFFYHFFFFFLIGNHNPGSILNTNFSHNQLEFSTDITKMSGAFYPLGLTMFCRRASKMEFSKQPWHLNTPCTGNSERGFRLGEYPLTYPIGHSACFKIPRNTLCACPYSRAMSEKGMFIYSGIGILFLTDKIWFMN